MNDNDDDDSDDDEDDEYGRQQQFLYHSNISYKKFGQGNHHKMTPFLTLTNTLSENILFARSAHTPPTLWMYRDESGMESFWPKIDDDRHTHSAPPAAIVSPSTPRKNRRHHRGVIADKTRRQQSPPSIAAAAASTIANNCSTLKLSPESIGNTDIKPSSFTSFASSSSHVSPHSSNSISQYLTDEPARCNKCDRVFRKASELKIHEHVHSFGNSNSRRYAYPCPECKQPQRSKPSLQKHIETNHPDHHHLHHHRSPSSSFDSANHLLLVDERSSDGDDIRTSRGGLSSTHSPSSTTNVMTSSSAPSGSRGNPRPFVCTDCQVGFRIHGHLAKHLRSKMHVMKLENSDKLPEGTYLLIETSGGACLNDIDTTDCDRARSSLLALARTLGGAEGTIDKFIGSSTNLECAEEMLAPSPAPMITPRLRCESMPTKTCESMIRRRCESVSSSTSKYIVDKIDHSKNDDSGDTIVQQLINNRHVSANVWIPPRVEQLPELSSSQRRTIANAGEASSIAAARLLLEAAAICDKAGKLNEL